MGNVLVSWIGHADLKAPSETEKLGLGPLAQAITTRTFDEVVILCDYPKNRVAGYFDWVSGLTTTKIRPYYESLSGPTQFGEIYEAAVIVVSDVMKTSWHLHRSNLPPQPRHSSHGRSVDHPGQDPFSCRVN